MNLSDTPDGCTAIHRDVDWMEKWAERNLMKFIKREFKVLYLRNKPKHEYMLAVTVWKAALQKRH